MDLSGRFVIHGIGSVVFFLANEGHGLKAAMEKEYLALSTLVPKNRQARTRWRSK